MKYIKSPMPGKVIGLEVKVGDTIDDDTEAFILESMKMELPVHAGVTGIVKSISVSEGDTVPKGHILAEVE